MMIRHTVSRCLVLGIALSLTLPAAGGALAQDGPRKARKLKRERMSFAVPANPDRGLTVRRRFPRSTLDGEDFEPSIIGQDPDEAYGNIAAFNPAPYVTSGTQYPYGLDGVGGYGSDLGFDAAGDGQVYQR